MEPSTSASAISAAGPPSSPGMPSGTRMSRSWTQQSNTRISMNRAVRGLADRRERRCVEPGIGHRVELGQPGGDHLVVARRRARAGNIAVSSAKTSPIAANGFSPLSGRQPLQDRLDGGDVDDHALHRPRGAQRLRLPLLGGEGVDERAERCGTRRAGSATVCSRVLIVRASPSTPSRVPARYGVNCSAMCRMSSSVFGRLIS